MSYDWKGQADMFLSEEDVDRIKARATGNGAAIGFGVGFFVALAVFAVIGAYL